MKNLIYKSLILIGLITSLNSCDKGFVEVNTDPVRQISIDPKYLLAQAQYNSALNTQTYQLAIVQQIIHPFSGTPSGGNQNVYNDSPAGAAFGSFYSGPVKYLIDVIKLTKDDPARQNLYHMARIWKAYVFMVLVDTYGDVPYSEAGLAHYGGPTLPKYDAAEDIYADLYNELKTATAALDATQAAETNDLFYKGNIPQWKKLGYSLMLRLGMRYSKIDPVKAKSIAAEAFAGGVMTSNSDNATLIFNSTYTNSAISWVYGEMSNIYMGAPFIDYLKSTADPRIRVFAVRYANPSNKQDPGAADTEPANQIGMPFGYNDGNINTAPGYPGKIGTAWRYSQPSRTLITRVDAPWPIITYSQTKLLVAEAAFRGWITGDAKSLYEAGVRANMDQMEMYAASAKIAVAAQDAYLALNPYNPAKALEQINTQYWISSYLEGSESWANFRRTGFPPLVPNPYPQADPAVKGGFIRRLTYPSRESNVNPVNLQAAIDHMGPNNLATRIFWDK